MSNGVCDREAEVVSAVHGGLWSSELREHAASCSSCAETAFVSFHLRTAAAAMSRQSVPDPGILWRRSRLAQQAVRLRHATRLIVGMQLLSIMVAAATAVFAVVRGWPMVRSFTRELTSGIEGASSTVANAEPGIVLLVSFAVLMGLVLHEMWCHACDS